MSLDRVKSIVNSRWNNTEKTPLRPFTVKLQTKIKRVSFFFFKHLYWSIIVNSMLVSAL